VFNKNVLEGEFMSTPISQKTAVVNAVAGVLGGSFVPGETQAKESLSSEQLNEVRESVLNGILNGEIQFNGDTGDSKSLSRYVNGMIDNHFRKAKELNGGIKYTPANPGKGRRDPQLSALKKLAKNYSEGTDEFVRVTSAIQSREQELSEERKISAASRKRDSVLSSIDTSVLPEDLQETLAQGN
jgi:hypothetical protein